MAHPAKMTCARPQSAQAERYYDALMAHGYVIIPNLVDADLVSRMNADMAERFESTPFCRGSFYGSRTKRFGRLLARSPHATNFIQHELILQIVERVLKPHCDVIQLNLTQAIEIHPGSPGQVPHRDQDMWAGAKGSMEYLVNVMWPLTPYTGDNGATTIWPDSHRCQDQMVLPAEQAIGAEMEPGSVLLFLGSTLHGAGTNVSNAIRRGMIVSYSLGWLKSYENQFLAYPPHIARTFSPELAALVGYRQHRPNLGNYEGQCPSVLLQDNVPEHLPAIDELRPDQEQLIADFHAGKLSIAA